MKTLIYQEITIQNKIYNIPKYTLIFFIFCNISITMINSYENIRIFGVVFSVIAIPLAFLNLSNYLIKPDIEDGKLETLLTVLPPIKIILSKYVALCTCSCLSFIIAAPLIYIIYDVQFAIFTLMLAGSLALLLLSAALIILIAAIQGYFRSNTNFLTILIMPLLIPNILLSGILLQSPTELYLLPIMLGINLLIIPPALYLSSYLIENIYNI